MGEFSAAEFSVGEAVVVHATERVRAPRGGLVVN